jgi:glycosyltransferase involved in cell wall biosynthesis
VLISTQTGSSMSNTTVIIKTIGRPTLKAAIASAKREGLKPIVISDGVNCHAYGEKFVKLGRQWGFYGGMAANVGAALAETPYITFLDDDDVFLPGAGKIIESKTTENPEVDIWIAGVRFNREVALHNTQTGEETYRGTDLAIFPERGLSEGNVAMPTYKTKIFETLPYTNCVPDDVAHLTDLIHVRACAQRGSKVAWFEEALYHVRPHMAGKEGIKTVNGRGE